MIAGDHPQIAEAIAAIDAGDTPRLSQLIDAHPQLVRDRIETGETGYFARPHLLWFIAWNPIRPALMPANAAEIAGLLADALHRHAAPGAQPVLDYAVGLVATGMIPREAGLQLDLIDALIAKGARPHGLDAALAHRELAAAQRLLQHGARLTLAAAAAFRSWGDAEALIRTCDREDAADALMIAAHLPDPDAVAWLLDHGADPNARSRRLHAHSTPLHQAALEGSLPAVTLLVNAGAWLDVRDDVHNGTPKGWADHGGHEDVAAFLAARGG